ncbi:MAG TPA: hypothetical protein DCQ06_10895 [Myxococcales bacterium]|nr:hypothetical protein [Myxococcales bacterium]
MPALDPGGFGTPSSAYTVADIELSQVVYHAATCDNRTLWFRVPATAGQKLFVQLGAPELDRLKKRPMAIALLGAGFDDIALPFSSPITTGRRWDIAEAGAGKAFHEPFTDTYSWITVEDTVTLPETGDYWLVAWFPDNISGKLWLSVGTVEKFNAETMIKVIPLLDQVRAFHETLPEQKSVVPVEAPCGDFQARGVAPEPEPTADPEPSPTDLDPSTDPDPNNRAEATQEATPLDGCSSAPQRGGTTGNQSLPVLFVAFGALLCLRWSRRTLVPARQSRNR